MRLKACRILMLCWLSLWFGVIVPGHERGAIALPGMEPKCVGSCEPSGETCHQVSRHDAQPADQKKSENPNDRFRRCAVCFVVARLQTPVTINLELPEVGLLGLLPAIPLTGLASVAPSFVPLGRGPPCSV